MLCQTKGVSICPHKFGCPYVWMIFGCPLYIHNTKKTCFVRLRGCPYAPIHLGHPNMSSVQIYWGVQTYRGHLNIWGIKCIGAIWHPLSLTKHAFFVLCMYSRHPNIFQTYMGAPKCMGVSKHTGGIQTYGGIKIYRRVSKHMGASKHTGSYPNMGHPNIWGCLNIQGASKHGEHLYIQGAYKHMGVSKHTGSYPNIWGI